MSKTATKSALPTNLQLFNGLRKQFADFESITAEATAETFTEKGWGAIQRENIDIINKFFSLSMKVAFNKLDIAEVNTRLSESGLVETYSEQFGGFLQRISVNIVDPVSPGYLDLMDGDSVDMQTVSKPDAKERFFECGNDNFQSTITIQPMYAKTLFLDEYGMSNFIAGIMKGLEEGYKQQQEVNIYKAIHECINSVDAPLQDSQKITLDSWTDAGVTDDELMSFIAALQDLGTAMETSITAPGFNANGFNTKANVADYKVYVRAGIVNKIRRQLRVGAYNPEDLTLPFEIVEVPDFGGTKHYIDIESTPTLLYPHYTKMGKVDGWALSEGGDKAYDKNAAGIYTVDTDADVLAMVAQNGLIFRDIKEPFTVIPAPFNARGLYTTYWASAANNMIRYDANYGCVIVKKPA